MRKYNKGLTFLLITAFVLAVYVSAAGFKDIKETDWFAEAVGKLSELDIVNGLPDGSFNPQGEVTRAQFIKMLVQAMEYKKIDSVSFIDMKPYPASKPHWASVYVETALRNKVILKSEEGDRFYPDAPITRKDMVLMICRALKLNPSDGSNPYFDLEESNGYFTKAYEEYLVRGIPMNGKIIFNPTGVTTRAQAAVIISRLVDYRADPAGFAAKAAMEERIANGTATAEDIALKRELEIEKAKADPNYIIEPNIRIINTRNDFEVMGDRADRSFN
ncbi:MAG TPA: S-layer homology domain-containing protein, partial [Bacillota bacterium]|nr:S-layer homology domain-containing protein [Bacillota bacterium]